jgi:ribosomal protein S24E
MKNSSRALVTITLARPEKASHAWSPVGFYVPHDDDENPFRLLYLTPFEEASKVMQIVSRKDSKLLGRTEVEVLFPGKAGALNRKEAIKEVAQAMNASEGKVTLLRLSPAAGTQALVGRFHVYDSEENRKKVSHEYLSVRLLTKEEKDALKAAKKKAETAAPPAAKKK